MDHRQTRNSSSTEVSPSLSATVNDLSLDPASYTAQRLVCPTTLLYDLWSRLADMLSISIMPPLAIFIIQLEGPSLALCQKVGYAHTRNGLTRQCSA